MYRCEFAGSFGSSFMAKTFVDATGAMMYSCFRCNRLYQHMKTLNRHLRHECGKGKQFICVFCGHRTQRSDRLLTHIRSQHPKLAQDYPKRKRQCLLAAGIDEAINPSAGSLVDIQQLFPGLGLPTLPIN